ncbi:hypothetical protein [Candidatus Poriferisodalis sp.]|uniref:hypothetical protein n=1 Tax=Candidatus Poriferisodalis sp. TaxID=3101277 RepID=UPI003AF60904
MHRAVARHGFRPSHVVDHVRDMTGLRFTAAMHAEVARALGVRPPKGQPDRTMRLSYAEYLTSYKGYLYTPAWVERLVKQFSAPGRFEELTGTSPIKIDDADSP